MPSIDEFKYRYYSAGCLTKERRRNEQEDLKRNTIHHSGLNLSDVLCDCTLGVVGPLGDLTCSSTVENSDTGTCDGDGDCCVSIIPDTKFNPYIIGHTSTIFMRFLDLYIV